MSSDLDDLLKQARGLDTYGYQSQLACRLADEIERLRAALKSARQRLKDIYESGPKEPYELAFDDCLIAQEIDQALGEDHA